MIRFTCFFSRYSNPLLAFIPWAMFSLGLFVHPLGPSVAAQEEHETLTNAALVQSLGEKWELQREDLSLVEIGYRTIRGNVPDEHNISRDDVMKLIHRLVANSEPKTLARVAVALDPRAKGMQLAWIKGIFIMDGESFLSEESIPGIVGNVSKPFTFVRHDGYVLRARPSLPGRIQVDIEWEETGLRSGPQGLHAFVLIPPVKFMNAAQITQLQVKDEEDRLSFSNKSIELIVSSETGFVHEYRRGKYGNRAYIETFQFKPQKHGKTIVMPQLYFRNKYSGNRLSSFKFRLIDKITTDPEAISRGVQIAVLPGDTVIVHTGDTREMIKVSQPTNDVLALVFDPEIRKFPMR